MYKILISCRRTDTDILFRKSAAEQGLTIMIEITSPSRIHMSLIDMNGESGRIDGGVGLALDLCGVRLRARKIAAGDVVISGCPAMDRKVENVIRRLLPEDGGIEIDFAERMPMHIGLGIGTQSLLSAAAAVNELYGLGKNVRELAEIAGRGGTSGIGTHAFEAGGFIVDGGHRTADKKKFAPSSASCAPVAPVLFRKDFPEDWDVILAVPEGHGLSGPEESAFFRRVCPFPVQEIREISYVILMQMLPALVEKDIETFGNAVDQLQSLGFNRPEHEIQPAETPHIIDVMKKAGISGVGLSSFGPALYGFSDSRSQSEEIRDAVLSEIAPGGRVYITKAKNTGAVCRHV